MEYIIHAVDLRVGRIAARHRDIDFEPIPFVVVFEIIEWIKEIIPDHNGTVIIRRIAVKNTGIRGIRESTCMHAYECVSRTGCVYLVWLILLPVSTLESAIMS